MLPAMPKAKEFLADTGDDAAWFRAALAKRGVAACIPSKSNRKAAIPYDALLYKQSQQIENMFGRLKRLVPHPHPIRPLRHIDFSASCIAAVPFGSDHES
jgi:hypothetical protein